MIIEPIKTGLNTTGYRLVADPGYHFLVDDQEGESFSFVDLTQPIHIYQERNDRKMFFR